MESLAWMDEEVEILRRAYPSAPWSVLLRVLPDRTWSGVTHKAHRLGISRTVEMTLTHKAAFMAARPALPRLGKFVHPVVVRDGVEGKVCSGKCGEWRPLEKFARHADCAGGRRSICTTCEGRRAYANNREARIATVRRYQKNNPDTHRLHKRAADRRRHGRMLEGPGVSSAELRALLEQHDGKCAYCGAPADTIDHATPLARGGKHAISNLLPACKKCNFTKKTKTREEFMQDLERIG